MKVTLINKDDSGGGAAMASVRLFKALQASNVDVEMLVQNKASDIIEINSTIHNTFDALKAQYSFFYERLLFIPKEKHKLLRFAFSTANAGIDIANEPSIINADLLHLHWINGAFLSLDNLDKLFALRKPTVWTLHDMWPFTGGCHYSGVSEAFLQQCGNCHFLSNPYPNDISHNGWLKKKAIYSRNKNITFVACSNWMKEMAQKSSLLEGFEVVTIPNPIDTTIYMRKEKSLVRKKWNVPQDAEVILFGAANINHTRKGISYLIAALHEVKKQHQTVSQNIHVVVFGKSKGFDFSQIPFPVVNLPVINSESDLAEIYSLANVFVLPSLEDNLPNMVMEALSCSTPVVAFNAGGIADMVEHERNGYLAEYKSTGDLANGIITILNATDDDYFGMNARKTVLEKFSYSNVAEQHINLYQRLLSH